MPSFEKQIRDLKELYDIEIEVKKIEERTRERDNQIVKKYRDQWKIQVDKIRRKNDHFLHFDKKKETPVEKDQIPKFLEASLEIQKNKTNTLISQKRVYELNIARTDKLIQRIAKQYTQFITAQRQQSKTLRGRIADLTSKLQDFRTRYANLSEQSIAQSSAKQIERSEAEGTGLIPFLSEKIDAIFQREVAQANLGTLELERMKGIGNDVIGKIQYLLQLISKKEAEKKELEAENDAEIEHFQKQREEFVKRVEQAKLRQKQALQQLELIKEEEKRHLKTIFIQKKKFDYFLLKVAEYRRTIKRLNYFIAYYRERQQKRMDIRAKKKIDDNEKIEVLIRREREKEQFEREIKLQKKQLAKQKEFFESIERQDRRREQLGDKYVFKQRSPEEEQKFSKLMQNLMKGDKNKAYDEYIETFGMASRKKKK